MDKKILISCPVSNRAWVLPYYLRNLYNLDYNKKLIDIYWIVNNSKDNSLELLNAFKEEYENEYNSITIEIYNSKRKFVDDRITEIRREYTYNWLAELRNKMLKKAVKIDVDFLFSSDSDILFTKDTLLRLVEHNEDVVASLIYNGYLYGDKLGFKYPNILRELEKPRTYEHISNYRIKNPQENIKGLLIPVDFTGAIFLIKKDVCANAKFGANLDYGEDEPFCYSARQAGYKLWCDISLYNQHIMSIDLLDEFKNFGL